MNIFRIRLICALAAAAIALAVPVVVLARPAESFTITSYDVHVTVSEDNTCDVAETIAVKFTEPRHGIFRNIALRGERVRDSAHGGSTEWTAQVTDVQVEGYGFTVDYSGPDVVVKIGSADAMVEGEQVYRLTYRMQFADDGAPAFDEVYYDLIGSGWDTTIDAATFSVTLPQPFDPELAGLSMGPAGASGYKPEELQFSVDGNTISGRTLRPLQPHEALTLRVELPQGYFLPSTNGAGAVPEVALPDTAMPNDVPFADGPQPVGGIHIGLLAGLLAGGGVVLLGAGVVAVIVVLAFTVSRGRGGGAATGGFAGRRINDDMLDQMNQQNQHNQMLHMNEVNQMNQMDHTNQQPPSWTDTNSGGFTGGTSGGGSGGGGGGSW